MREVRIWNVFSILIWKDKTKTAHSLLLLFGYSEAVTNLTGSNILSNSFDEAFLFSTFHW